MKNNDFIHHVLKKKHGDSSSSSTRKKGNISIILKQQRTWLSRKRMERRAPASRRGYPRDRDPRSMSVG